LAIEAATSSGMYILRMARTPFIFRVLVRSFAGPGM
jgi:hypothetical protein